MNKRLREGLKDEANFPIHGSIAVAPFTTKAHQSCRLFGDEISNV
jgi:hypothetical protein